MTTRQSRFAILGLALVALLAALAGCGGSSDSSAGESSSSGLTKVRFISDYNPPWVGQVPFDVALEKGWFKEAGLDVDYKLPPSNAEPPRLVGTGNADVTVSYSPDLLVAASKGLKVKALASIMDRNIGGLFTLDPSIQNPKDLEGKTVAVYDFPMSQLNWDTFAKHYGIDQSKVKKVSEGSYGVPLVVSGKVDAADGAAGGEVTDAEMKSGKKAKFWVYQPQNGIPKFYWFVIAGNSDWVQNNPEAAKQFVATLLRAQKWSEENPVEAAKIFAKRNPRATSEEAAVKGWADLLRYTKGRFVPSKPAGWMDPAIWQSYEKFLVAQKYLSKPVDPSTLLTDNKYVPGS